MITTILFIIFTQVFWNEPVFQSLFLLFQQQCEIVKFESDTFTCLVQLGDSALSFAVLCLALFHLGHVFNVSGTMGGSEGHKFTVGDFYCLLFILDFDLR